MQLISQFIYYILVILPEQPMNQQDNSNSFHRTMNRSPYHQTYAPYPMSQMVQGPPMSQMSQDYNDYSFKYKTIQPSDMMSANQMHSMNYTNRQNNQSNIISGNQMSRVSNINQYPHNSEQLDIDTLISPVILKAYAVLRECELKPNSLDKIQESLREKLQVLRKQHQNFKNKMEDLIQIAERKQKMADQLIKKRTNKNIQSKHSNDKSRSKNNLNMIDKTKNKTHEDNQSRSDIAPSRKRRRPGRPSMQKIQNN